MLFTRRRQQARILPIILVLLGCSSCTNPLKNYLAEQKAKKRAESSSFSGGQSAYAKIFSKYEAIRAALASDDLSQISTIAKDLSSAIGEAERKGSGDKRELIQKLRLAVNGIGTEKDSEKVRIAFGTLSEPIVALSKTTGEGIFDYYYCPMAKGYAYWVQPKGQPISNPYMGTKMSSCGSKVD